MFDLGFPVKRAKEFKWKVWKCWQHLKSVYVHVSVMNTCAPYVSKFWFNSLLLAELTIFNDISHFLRSHQKEFCLTLTAKMKKLHDEKRNSQKVEGPFSTAV